MPRRGQRDEELASIGVGPSVRHAEDSGGGVGELGDDFVGESAAVDGGAAAAGAGGVAGLDHEVADDAVGGDGVVVACCGEGGEVVAGLGRGLVLGWYGCLFFFFFHGGDLGWHADVVLLSFFCSLMCGMGSVSWMYTGIWEVGLLPARQSTTWTT